MSECFNTAIAESPDFLLGILAGLLLYFVIKGIALMVEWMTVVLHPFVMELCMLGNLRLSLFGIKMVIVNPLLAREVRLRLKTI